MSTGFSRFGRVFVVLALVFASCRGGAVVRDALTLQDLTEGFTAAEPLDMEYLSVPENAAAPRHTFEGRLELLGEAEGGNCRIYGEGELEEGFEHLPEFDFEFVQSEGYLIPMQRGLIKGEHTFWDLILEAGRAWQEEGDRGWTRASFPFFLIPRGGNSTYHGVMTFLFNDDSVSKVWYEIAQETGTYYRADLWGLLDAQYHPGEVEGAEESRQAFMQELAARMPTRPFDQLEEDFPGVNAAAFTEGLTPEHLTTYGLVVNGVHYRGGCPTRYGEYPYCDSIRMPSYSTAKTAFVALALMRLAQEYGAQVPDLLVKDYVPETANSPGDWSTVTFNNTLDMATGNYEYSTYMVDEEERIFTDFFGVETYAEKIEVALDWPNRAMPGTRWVYRSSDTFILVTAMQNYLRSQQGEDADLFEYVVDEVYRPLGLGAGFFSTMRTSDNNWHGTPIGASGLWWIPDDAATLGNFLLVEGGMINGEQILDPALLQAGLQQNPDDRGVDMPGGKYNNAFWGQHYGSYQGFHCDFYMPYMAGYSGVVIALLPNGVTYYYFSDNREFNWDAVLVEADKIAPLCPQDG